MNRERKYLIGLALCLLLGWTPMASEAGEAGKFIFVHGQVTVMGGTSAQRPAKRGMELFEGETVVTGAKGTAQLRMKDGAMLALRPDTELRIDEYAYGEPGREESSGLSLLKGTFRSLTGAIGHNNKEAYQVRTPVATIGIRGTDHEPTYIPPSSGKGRPGVYDKVNAGRTYIENEAGRIELGPNQVGYTGDRYQAPMRLSMIPNFYSVPASEAGGGDSNSEVSAGSETETVSSAEEASTESTALEEDIGSTDRNSAVTTTTATDEAQVTTMVATSNTGDALDLTNESFSSDGGSISLDDSLATQTPVPGKQVGGSFVGTAGGWPVADAKHLGIEPWDSLTFDDGGNLVRVDYGSRYGDTTTFEVRNPRNAESAVAQSHDLTGIAFGRMQADAIEVSWVDYSGTLMTDTYDLATNNGYFHWIVAPRIYPEYLPQVFKGQVSYSLDGGTRPTDENGNSGTLIDASLTADFSNLLVDYHIQASAAGRTWDARESGVAIDGEGFHSSTPSISIDGTYDPAAYGTVSGGFSGDGMSGAYMNYAFEQSYLGYALSGAVALSSGTAQSSAIDHHVIIFAGDDPRGLAGVSPSLVGGGYNNVVDSTTSGGSLTGFRGELDNDVGERETVTFTYSGTVADAGTDPETGISWGRWAGPTAISATHVADGSDAGFSPESLHYLSGPVTDSPATLPVSGTVDYIFAGGTRPTDNFGNVGEAPTASDFALNADFTNMNVDVSAQATVAGLTLRGDANDVPLDGIHFDAGTKDGVALAVTCPAGCATSDTLSGQIVGGFTGEGATGAGIAYSLQQTSGTTDTVISGVAAFHR